MNGYNPMLDYQRNQLLAQQAAIQNQLAQLGQPPAQYQPNPQPPAPQYFVREVASFEDVKRVPPDPCATYLFPDTTTGKIYMKRLNSDTGRSEYFVYALENDAIILYDSAYEAFITEDLPRSIFAIEGARKCAIEMCSLSKTAGFTGTRCGYTIIPKELERDGHNIYATWYRRQATKFNGVSWPVQCAAAAVFSEEGQKQIKENISYYQENARIISSALDELGIYYTGGKNSPYIWLKCPNNMGSWEFFDLLLKEANVVGTPGEGFGENGAGYFRLTSFGDRENTIEAVERIKKLLSNL